MRKYMYITLAIAVLFTIIFISYSYTNKEKNNTASSKNMSIGIFTVKLEIHESSPKSLVINDDGMVTFKEGDKTNQVQVSAEVIDSLKQYILDKGFFSLEEKYEGTGCCDFIANTIVVSIGDKTHSVYCYNQCPKKFDDIVEKIKSLWPYKIEYYGFT